MGPRCFTPLCMTRERGHWSRSVAVCKRRYLLDDGRLTSQPPAADHAPVKRGFEMERTTVKRILQTGLMIGALGFMTPLATLAQAGTPAAGDLFAGLGLPELTVT